MNLFVVMPESIPDRVKEDLKISTADTLVLVKLREDANTAKGKGKTLAEIPPTTNQPPFYICILCVISGYTYIVMLFSQLVFMYFKKP